MHRQTHIYHIFILCIIFILHSCMCSLYSKESNLNNDEDDREIDFRNEENPFRMQKSNLLWAKGKKVLPGTKLAGLYTDLKVHDKHEAHLKKMRLQDMDMDGAMEAKVLNNYRRIVDYYGLDLLSSQSVFMSNEIPLENNELKNIKFQDSKLQTMWKKAEEAGFSEKDLNMLKEEFWHQQMKIDEYAFVHRELNKFADPNDNTVELEHAELKLLPKDASEKKATLKKNKMDIKEGYMMLEHLVSSMPASEAKFRDGRVHKLWALAQKTNWTEEQLNGFKEELLHFEHRLNKQSYYRQQLELSSDTLRDQDEDKNVPDSHKHLEEKTKNLGHKIKKLHMNFKTRLDDALQHSEL